LFSATLASDPAARREDEWLGKLLRSIHEPRWLIQTALIRLLLDRARSEDIVRSIPARSDQDSQYRNLAMQLLDSNPPLLERFYELLEVAAEEYFFIVALPEGVSGHILQYESTLTSRYARQPKPRLRVLRNNYLGYYVQYESEIPPNLKSYYLQIESSPGIEIAPMYMSTEAESSFVSNVRADLGDLARRLQAWRSSQGNPLLKKALELELQSACRRLTEVCRRRSNECDNAGLELADARLANCKLVVESLVGADIADGDRQGHRRSLVENPIVTPTVLEQASDELRRNEMHRDLSVDSDPASVLANAYWRQSAPTRATDNIKVRSGFVLRDTSGSGPRSVVAYLLAVASITYLLTAFLAKSPWPFSDRALQELESIKSPEAVIALMLLVPGFLYSQLEFSPPNSIAGQLRALPRSIARASIALVAVSAAAVAAPVGGRIVATSLSITIVLTLLGAVLLQVRRRTISRTRGRLGHLGTLAWLSAPSVEMIDAPAWVKKKDRTSGQLQLADASFTSHRQGGAPDEEQ
jgi:hypothetical protein